jgi:mono/diheme cytochrome c family protein
MKLWLAGFCLFLTVVPQAFASSQTQRDRGAAVYAANGCGHCHSIRKAGGHKGPDLSGVGRSLSKARMREQILRGGNQMPPFTDNLEPAEVNDLVAYLRSCREKPDKN